MQSPIHVLLITLFDLYIMVVLLRFMLQLFRADFYNPLSQFVVKVTNPVLVPLRKAIPGIAGLDVASLIFAYLVILLKYFLLAGISGTMYNPIMMLIIGLADLLNQAVSLVFWLVLIRAIMSWINPTVNNPLMMVIVQITEPIMAPVRKLIPPLGGLDLSPLLLIIGLQFLMGAINYWIFSPLISAL